MTEGARRKQKNYRQRQRAGVVILEVPAFEYDLVNALIDAGLISPADALDRRKVAIAAGEVLHQWAEWTREHAA